jgi:fructose-bisphosphate aldolase class II
MAFGTALRNAVARDPERFDRIEILKDTQAPMVDVTRKILRNIGRPEVP